MVLLVSSLVYRYFDLYFPSYGSVGQSRKAASMFISKKIRLEVSEQAANALEFQQSKCRGLYNWWVMKLRDGEQLPGWEEAKKTLQQSKQHDPELCFVY